MSQKFRWKKTKQNKTWTNCIFVILTHSGIPSFFSSDLISDEIIQCNVAILCAVNRSQGAEYPQQKLAEHGTASTCLEIGDPVVNGPREVSQILLLDVVPHFLTDVPFGRSWRDKWRQSGATLATQLHSDRQRLHPSFKSQHWTYRDLFL